MSKAYERACIDLDAAARSCITIERLIRKAQEQLREEDFTGALESLKKADGEPIDCGLSNAYASLLRLVAVKEEAAEEGGRR